jgi:hypothetical protein
LRRAGLNADATTRELGKMADAMRQWGLRAEEVNRILADNTVETELLLGMFGKEAEQQFGYARIAMQGLAAELIGDTRAIDEQLTATVNDFGKLALIQHHLGRPIRTVEDLEEGIVRAGGKWLAMRKEMEAAGATALDIKARFEAEKGALGLVSFTAGQAAAAMHEQWQATKNAAGETVTFTEYLEAQTHAIVEDHKRTQEFYRALGELRDAFLNLTAPILRFIAECLLPLVKMLTWVVDHITMVLVAIKKFINYLETIPGLDWIIWTLKTLIGLFIVVRTAIWAVGYAVAGLGSLFGSVIGGMTSLWTGFVAFFRAGVAGMISSISAGVTAVFQAIGRALVALGRTIQPVILPLMGLGAALMMAGIGAYFFASGAKMLVDMGWEKAIQGIIGMTLAIAFFSLVLMGLAFVAQYVAVGLIVLGATFLMIGAAVWLVGAGMKMIAEAFVLIKDAIGPHSPALYESLPLVAAGLMAVGAAGLIATPGVIMAAGAMALFAASALIVTEMFVKAIELIDRLGVDKMQEVGEAFKKAAKDVMVGVSYLSIAGVMLITAAPLIIWGSIAMMNASSFLLAAGLSMIPAGFAVATGVWWLVHAFERFRGSIDLIERVAAALTAISLVLMTSTQITEGSIALARSAQEMEKALALIPDALEEAIKLTDFAEDLDNTFVVLSESLEGAAARLEEAVSEFRGPAEELTEILANLNEAAAGFDMRTIAAGLNELEGVSPEAITQVELMPPEKEDRNRELQELLIEQNTLIRDLQSNLETIAGGGDVRAIAALLHSHLPQIADKDSELGSELNRWS